MDKEYQDYLEQQEYALYQKSQQAQQEVAPKPFQPAENQDKLGFMDKLKQAGTSAIGMGASHIAGVAQPLAKLLHIPNEYQPQALNQAMDPEKQHEGAYNSGLAEGTIGMGASTAPITGPIAGGAATALGNPAVKYGLSAAIGGAAGDKLARLFGVFK